MDKSLISGFGFEVIEGTPFQSKDDATPGADPATPPTTKDDDIDGKGADPVKPSSQDEPDNGADPLKPENNKGEDGSGDDGGGANPDPDAKVSVFAQFARHRQKTGIIDPDAEIKNDLTESEYDDLILSNYRQIAEQELKEKYDEETLRIADDLRTGVSEQKIANSKIYERLFESDISGEDPVHVANQKRVIQAVKYDEGITDPEDLKAIVSKYEEKGILGEMAKQLQPKLKEISDKILSEVRSAKKTEVENDTKQAEENKEKLVSAIRSKKYDGLEVNDQEAEALENWVYKRDQVIFNEKGMKVRVSGFEKLQHEVKTQPDKQAQFLYMMKNGFSVLKGKGEEGLMTALSNFFEGKVEEAPASKKKPKSTTESSLDNILAQAEEVRIN